MYLLKESLILEFKEFFLLNIENYYSETYIKNIFINNININIKLFNSMIKNNLKYYIINYLPKYICNFSLVNINSNLAQDCICKSTQGQLVFGISDSGIIEGIPYFGSSLPLNIIYNTIDICLSKYIKIDTNNKCSISSKINWLKKNLKIIIKKLDINEYLLDNHYLLRLNKLKENYNKAKHKYNIFIEKYKSWYLKLIKYSIKLKDLINNKNMRDEILEFIINYTYKYDYDISMYYESLIFFNSNVYIDNEITRYDIVKYQYDYNHYISWIVLFKDTMLDLIKINKPIYLDSKPIKINYVLFAKQISNIRSFLLSNNCNFFILWFEIPINNDNTIFYYKDINNNWCCKKRYINSSGEPSTMSII
jgi:desulfoferrodoxin (superoxide reductase-like protein)